MIAVVVLAARDNDGRDSLSRGHDSTETGTPLAAETAGSTASAQTAPEPPTLARPLSSAERGRLVAIAGSIERAITLFDKTVDTCPKATRGGCVDRARSVVVVDLDWPPYYLRRFAARTRGCALLAVAVQGVNGFNLAARQVDFGDPGDYATPTRRRSYHALVDELRAAAASGYRSR